MEYSLINIYAGKDNRPITGIWIKNVSGSLFDAVKAAEHIEKLNDGKVRIAVVEKIDSSPNYNLYKDQINLRIM